SVGTLGVRGIQAVGSAGRVVVREAGAAVSGLERGALRGAEGAAAEEAMGCISMVCGHTPVKKPIGICFIAGTRVVVPGPSIGVPKLGTKPIEELSSGGLVLARDEITGEKAWNGILRTICRKSDQL